MSIEYKKENINDLRGKCGVYRLTNTTSNKVYIGSSEDLESRLQFGHLWALENDQHHNIHLTNSFNKHGRDINIWKIEVLSLCEVEDQILEEQFFLDSLIYAKEYRDTSGKDKRFLEVSYNLSPTAGKTTGYKHTEEEVKAMSLRSQALWQQDWYRKKLLDLYATEEFREAKSKRAFEIFSRPEVKEKITLKKKENWQDPEYRSLMTSITSSEEYREKHRTNTTELWKDSEYRDKIHTVESNKKTSETVIELWKNEDYRKKVEDSQRDPEVNRKRQKSRLATMTKEGYSNPGNKVVELVNRETGEVALSFTSVQSVQKYIKDTFDKVATNIRYYTDRPHKDYFGYMWRYKEDKKR